MPLASQTISKDFTPSANGDVPHLFLALVCDRLSVPSIRICLHGVEELSIGRGDLDRGGERSGSGARLALCVPDDRMSGDHATFRRVMGRWFVEDTHSRNGTLLNGRRIDRKVLEDGDLLELGHSFFIFRGAIPPAPAAGPVVYSDERRPAAEGFETLLPSLAREFVRAETIARTSIPVVLRGATGTGKEVIASAIHALSGRHGAFVSMDCGALSPALLQSELLGHCKGAFSGAREDRAGLVRNADGGTLFLDGVEELPAAAQPLLLRVLEHGEVLPVGAKAPIKVDVRVVAASQQNLEALAAEQRFRSDLLARLSGLTLELPPVRERREDLGLLVRALLRRKLGQSMDEVGFTCEAARALFVHGWPRNLRELEKALEAALVLAGRERIGLHHLPAAVVREPPLPANAETPLAGPPAGATAPAAKVQHFIDELSRRHVVRVVVAYAVAVFGALQGADVIVTRLSLPPQWMTWIVAACLAGLPVAVILAWIFDWTRQGIVRTPPISADQRALLARGRRRRKRTLVLAGCILGVIGAVGAMWWRNRARPSPSTRQTNRATERTP
ncbi:MAG: hypothetical protein AUG04_03765 [Deltaproteobacteria bacterium 13_1_20CM_2_69_21]|nr:MAG: hypothetical protein AUG04_03765 [Deltaproteobacteria bacterium 13_1_20CM_2_69_21]